MHFLHLETKSVKSGPTPSPSLIGRGFQNIWLVDGFSGFPLKKEFQNDASRSCFFPSLFLCVPLSGSVFLFFSGSVLFRNPSLSGRGRGGPSRIVAGSALVHISNGNSRNSR